MARLHILSDLHLEFGAVERPDVQADVTLLAGDIYTNGRCCPWQDAERFFGRPVAMILGNHEFYGRKIDTEVAKLKVVAAARRITVLENEQAVVAGVRVLGCTLWSDFRLFAGDDLARVKLDASRCVGTRYTGGVNDFLRIRVARDGYRRFRPKDAAMLHQASVAWLQDRLAEPFDGPTVVMTHYAPSARCVPASLMEDRLTCAYASRLDWLIEEHQPDMWIWGHVHGSVPEFSIGRTRMISNPRGYTPDGLNARFRPDLVAEV